MGFLDDLDKVARERIVGSPAHSLQKLGSLERIVYINRIGSIQSIGTVRWVGTVAVIGTMLVSVHTGTVHKVGTFGYGQKIGTITKLGYQGTLNYQGRLGTVGRLGTIHQLQGGDLGTIKRVGTLHYGERIGTVQRIGTVKWLGTLQRISYVGQIGSISRIGSAHVGTVPVNMAAQDIMVGVDLQARYLSGAAVREGTNTRLGCGSTWTGSWYAIDRYLTKTCMIKMWGTLGYGSITLIGGMTGTTQADGTFTYYGPQAVPKGSSGVTYSFTEALMYIKPKVRQHGGPAGSWQSESGGTISFHLGRQA